MGRAEASRARRYPWPRVERARGCVPPSGDAGGGGEVGRADDRARAVSRDRIPASDGSARRRGEPGRGAQRVRAMPTTARGGARNVSVARDGNDLPRLAGSPTRPAPASQRHPSRQRYQSASIAVRSREHVGTPCPARVRRRLLLSCSFVWPRARPRRLRRRSSCCSPRGAQARRPPRSPPTRSAVPSGQRSSERADPGRGIAERGGRRRRLALGRQRRRAQRLAHRSGQAGR